MEQPCTLVDVATSLSSKPEKSGLASEVKPRS